MGCWGRVGVQFWLGCRCVSEFLVRVHMVESMSWQLMGLLVAYVWGVLPAVLRSSVEATTHSEVCPLDVVVV